MAPDPSRPTDPAPPVLSLSDEDLMARAALDDARAFTELVRRYQTRVVHLVNALRETGITVHRATREFAAGGKVYPAGSYVIRAAQPFRPHVLDMFEPQDHPNDFAYPGGPHDAEALLVSPRTGQVVIVTKGLTSRPRAYEAPGRPAASSGPAPAEVRRLEAGGEVNAPGSGGTFGAMCDALCEWQDAADVPLLAAGMLKRWIVEDLLAALDCQ